MANKTKLIPQSIEDEFRNDLSQAGTDQEKRETAQTTAKKKLMSERGLQWYNAHHLEIKAELTAIEKDVFNHCGTCGARLLDDEEEAALERETKK